MKLGTILVLNAIPVDIDNGRVITIPISARVGDTIFIAVELIKRVRNKKKLEQRLT